MNIEATTDAVATPAPAEVATLPHLSNPQLFAISAMPFALSALWGSLLTLLVPLQVEDLLRRSGLTPQQVTDQKTAYLGAVVAAGSLMALIVPPLVGALSDSTTNRLGRRRPWVIGGVLITVLGLFGMMTPANLVIYTIAYLLVQGGSNTAAAAYAGFIPDQVAVEQRGHASGWLGMMNILGNISGLLLGFVGLQRANADALLTDSQQMLTYGLIIAILLVFLAVTVVGVRERPLTGPVDRPSLLALLKSLWLDPRKYPDFAWVWITRFFVTMGFNTVQFFLVYFLQDVVGIGRDEVTKYGAILFLGLLLSAAVSSIVGGRISDQRGRKPLIYAAGVIMTVTGLAFISYIVLQTVPLPGPFLAAFNTIFYLGIAFGFGYGSYQAVDWALGTDVLPNKETAAAKDLGVWHIAMVLPGSLATPLAGGLLTLAGTMGLDAATRYSLIFVMSILYFILGTVLVRNVRKAR
jgi:MFS family permease